MDNTEKQATLAIRHRAMTIKTKNKTQNIKEMSNKRPTKKLGQYRKPLRIRNIAKATTL